MRIIMFIVDNVLITMEKSVFWVFCEFNKKNVSFPSKI